jgi:hypothetical protein
MPAFGTGCWKPATRQARAPLAGRPGHTRPPPGRPRSIPALVVEVSTPRPTFGEPVQAKSRTWKRKEAFVCGDAQLHAAPPVCRSCCLRICGSLSLSLPVKSRTQRQLGEVAASSPSRRDQAACSGDISNGRSTEQTAIFSRELRNAFMSDVERRVARARAARDHLPPRLDQAQTLLRASLDDEAALQISDAPAQIQSESFGTSLHVQPTWAGKGAASLSPHSCSAARTADRRTERSLSMASGVGPTPSLLLRNCTETSQPAASRPSALSSRSSSRMRVSASALSRSGRTRPSMNRHDFSPSRSRTSPCVSLHRATNMQNELRTAISSTSLGSNITFASKQVEGITYF